MLAQGGSGLSLTFAVQNTGNRDGKETTQLYVKFPDKAGEPGKRLVGWEKMDVAAGDTRKVSFKIDPLYLSVFNVKTD